MPQNVFVGDVAKYYDATSDPQFSPEALDPIVDFLTDLARREKVLEFAIGTGRVALPLRARGVEVHGIEISEDMAAELHAKRDGAGIPVTIGDMATTRLDERFALVYLVYNTISNLLTQAEQVACFRNAAAHLDPGGCFVIELEIPQLRRMPPGQSACPFSVTDAHLGFDTYELDPIGDFRITTAAYHEVGRRVAALGRRLVILQEGGYHVPTLGQNARTWLRGAEGRPYDPAPAPARSRG